MSGLEVFGAIATALGVIQMARDSLGRARRLGRTIDDLRVILEELMEIQHDVDPYEDDDLLIIIRDLVRDVKEMIEQNRDSGRIALTFLWTSSLDQEVQRINNNLMSVCRRLERRAAYESHS